jgi:hypothetical protein
MVGVINPNSTQTLAHQIESAKNADYDIAPGDKIPTEATTSLSAPSGTQPTSTPEPSEAPHGHKLSGGAIAGIVVGGVAFLAICAALFFFVGRTKSLKEVLERKDATVKGTPGPPGDFGNPASPGFPGSPYSPVPNQDYGVPPHYSQHMATDQHPSGWTSPHQGHMSMISNPP